MLRRCGLGLLLLLAAPAAASAQYFGQNKIQYTSFDFKVVQTEHFDVYYYESERVGAMDVARMAERSYARLARVLHHQFRERKPIILYASHSDFQQTNATPGGVGEGTGGFTDFLKHRNVMPMTGSYKETEEVLTHEMVHQFQYDIWSGGRAGAGLGTIMAVNPPLWFVEGMAAYLSRGPFDPETAMWLRDAALEGNLPTINQLTNDPRIFPYRYGQALLSYIGERWGDEAIGAILQGSRSGGLEASFRRVLGLSLDQLSSQWRDAVQKKYFPEIGDRVKARTVSTALLTEERSKGTLHLAPSLSPDGSQVVYFSEKDFYFVDLYLADGVTGKVKRRLSKSTFSGSYETFRFINSQANWSSDGRYLAFAAKRGPRDDIVVLDVERNREMSRITVPDLNGVTTPAFSPDGRRIVFTGYDGGLSDLFVVNVDGTGLRRLTHDKHADLHPVWSPDGRSIAFATDRGSDTDFETLRIGNLRIALFDLDMGTIRVLPQMERGKNISPQWGPDGRSIAFVSDRNGVSNVFLYELADDQVYQLTDFYTGVQGITSLSPVLSWAPGADRLAFVYYENDKFDVYTLANPRGLKRRPYEPPAADSIAAVALTTAAPPAVTPTAESGRAPSDSSSRPQVGEGGSIYRSSQGFRSSDELARADSAAITTPVSISALLDSATLALPDTNEFKFRPYQIKFTPDYVARPSIGYTRDNFGRGVFGGSAITLSDMLGNKTLIFAGYINGRISEASVLAAYVNMANRINYGLGVSQEPFYFYEPSEIRVNDPQPGQNTFVTNVRRLVLRSVFTQASYPFSRFKRIEGGLRFANVDDALLSVVEPYDASSGFATEDPFLVTDNRRGINYVQPQIALVHDNTVYGYISPMRGSRSRLEFARTIGSWDYTQALLDYRRYDQLWGPFSLATQALYFGRSGPNADEFRIFAGSTDLLRGHTSGSYRRNECRSGTDVGTETGCAALDRLVGTQIALGKVELRFTLANNTFDFWPMAVPPIELVGFYDIGIAWDSRSTLQWNLQPGDDPLHTRTPLQTLGFGARTNLFGFMILRFDYSIPQERPGVGGFWTISLGPSF